MPDTHLPLHGGPTATERLFPTLSEAQIARISAHGRRRPITAGEILVEVGDKAVPFFVVISGAIQILRTSGGADTLIVTHRPGEFLGEGNMIAGRRALIRALVSETGEVLELDRQPSTTRTCATWSSWVPVRPVSRRPSMRRRKV